MADTAAVQLVPQPLFRSEYEQELEQWLHRRFRSMCIAYLTIGAIVFAIRMFITGFEPGQGRVSAIVITIVAAALSAGTIAYYFLHGQYRQGATRDQVLQDASGMILILGSISILKGLAVVWLSQQPENFLLPLFFWHFMACLFLPWTPRESLRPILPLMAAWALGVLVLDQDVTVFGRVVTVVFGPGILIPGLLICAFRLRSHIRDFRRRIIGKHFISMRQEYARARGVHESMFPQPHDDGYVRFEYAYTPMREIGGDYVHLHMSDAGVAHLTLLDVTGHGLPAALTVNRLFGELERIRAESPGAQPGEVLTLLNRYVNLTMLKHNIFATALSVTLDPINAQLHWANAGHPPAYLRGVNGTVTELAATGVLLGALEPESFEVKQRTIELTPGDVLVTYTDGAFEGRDRRGQSLGLRKLEQLLHIQPPPPSWPQFLAAMVHKHTAGRNDDDILIAALTFLAPRPREAALHGHQSMAARS